MRTSGRPGHTLEVAASSHDKVRRPHPQGASGMPFEEWVNCPWTVRCQEEGRVRGGCAVHKNEWRRRRQYAVQERTRTRARIEFGRWFGEPGSLLSKSRTGLLLVPTNPRTVPGCTLGDSKITDAEDHISYDFVFPSSVT